MIVEIHGAGFQNKGAELMLRTVVDELRRRVPQFVPAIDPTYGPYESRAQLGLYQIFPPRSHVGSPKFSRRFRKQKMFACRSVRRLFKYIWGAPLNRYGCVDLSSIDALIDIAGFAYTDEWGPQPTEDFAVLATYYKAKGKPVILLPQAFGPFIRKKTRNAFRRVLDAATLVFPRDQQSYEYVLELASQPTKIMKAPDITLFYPDVSFEVTSRQDRNYVCVVPNIRLLDQGKQQWGDRYEMYLSLIVKEIIRHGLQVYFTIYDTSGGDLEIACNIARKINSSCVTIVNERDPITLKELIGGALMLVGSRYHSLVAAFSKKVPAIALGWAHKYEMLLKDFGCEQLLVSAQTPIETVLELINHLIDQDVNQAYRGQIAGRLQEMYTLNQEMWDRVADVLSSSIC